MISAEVGLLKPDPRIYELAIRRAGSTPAAGLLVDDMPANVEGAMAIGMSGIVFKDTAGIRRELANRMA